MVDLKGNPFYLNDNDILWVKETLARMKIEDKAGQLLCLFGHVPEEDKIKEQVKEIKPGGVMFRPGPGAEVQRVQRELQQISNIPLLLAANLERGVGLPVMGLLMLPRCRSQPLMTKRWPIDWV